MSDISGTDLVEAERYIMVSVPTLMVSRTRVSQFIAGVDREWSHNMAQLGLNRIVILTSCNFFFGRLYAKNSKVKRAWPKKT